MPKLGLRPYASIEEGLDQYLGYNFSRLENVHERMPDVVSGVSLVTGSLTLETGLANLDSVVACFTTNPQANAAFLAANLQSSTAIKIDVYTSAFAVSVIAVYIRWIAVGELVLS